MKIHISGRCLVLLTALLVVAMATGRPVSAQENYTPTEANSKARAWFQDAKFGMFIHWGVYSVLGNGEWIMETRPINRTHYAKLPAFFNPIKFDPAAWVALAKAAGMKYITITSKHHDGFAMFDSKMSDWNIVARTPYGKDVIGMLAAECHRQGASNCFCTTRNWIGIRRIIFLVGARAITPAVPNLAIGMRISVLWTGSCVSC